MPHNDDLLLAELAAEIFGQVDAVSGDAIERDIGRVCSVAAEGVACAPLVPLDHNEGLLPLLVDFGLWPLRFARATMNNQHNRVGAVFAANADPLIDTAERDKQPSISLRCRCLCVRADRVRQ